MLRMQRSAEMRVREMSERAREAAQRMPPGFEEGHDAPGQPEQNTMPGMQENEAAAESNSESTQKENKRVHVPESSEPSNPESSGPRVAREETRTENTGSAGAPPVRPTILDELVGALGMDNDTLLIIGLLLILINQRAETTLILALAYLLL